MGTVSIHCNGKMMQQNVYAIDFDRKIYELLMALQYLLLIIGSVDTTVPYVALGRNIVPFSTKPQQGEEEEIL